MPTNATKQKKRTDTADEIFLAVISYISLLCMIPLLGRRSSEFAVFHGEQGLVLVFAWIVVAVLGVIPVIGWLIILPLGTITLVVLSVIGMLNALSGKKIQLPLIGRFARQLPFAR